ncbi:MAG: DUF1588 domain-containing protein [Myxococcales bacterium]|nr:DUF1588 domain-containing protein [Myxococcales bacterium]
MRAMPAAFGLGISVALVVALGGPTGCVNGDIGEFGSGGGAGAAPPIETVIEPGPGGIRRLLARQYLGSIRVVLGEAAAAVATPPKDIPLHGFSTIGAAQLSVTPSDVETYESSARAVAKAFMADDAAVAAHDKCAPTGPDDAACMGKLLTSVGRLLWRRQLDGTELDSLVGLATTSGTALASFDQGAAYAVTALLQAPEFLYIVELGEPAPIASDEALPERHWLTQTELATRMSFFFLDQTPSRDLLDAALAGKFATVEELSAAATTMLAQPEAKAALGAYYDEVFRLALIDEAVKDAVEFPEWGEPLKASMRSSARALLDDIVWTRDSDAREIVTADFAFVDAQLAPLYGLSSLSPNLAKMTLPAEQARTGLLGSAAFLSVFSHAARSSPTKRGVFIRRNLLCDTVPPPPADVVPQLPDDPSEGLTTKELLAQHMDDDACRSCHVLFDSLGWSLEIYDAIGRHRTKDKGASIDTSGVSPNVGEFAGPRELGALLFEHPQLPDCMVRNLYRNSMGHLETKGEEPAIAALDQSFAAGGFRVQDLLVAVATSPAFRMVGAPK